MRKGVRGIHPRTLTHQKCKSMRWSHGPSLTVWEHILLHLGNWWVDYYLQSKWVALKKEEEEVAGVLLLRRRQLVYMLLYLLWGTESDELSIQPSPARHLVRNVPAAARHRTQRSSEGSASLRHETDGNLRQKDRVRAAGGVAFPSRIPHSLLFIGAMLLPLSFLFLYFPSASPSSVCISLLPHSLILPNYHNYH